MPTVIKELLKKSSKLHNPRFRFKVSRTASAFNMKILRDKQFNLDALSNEKPSITSYGSKFKHVKKLEALLGMHLR